MTQSRRQLLIGALVAPFAAAIARLHPSPAKVLHGGWGIAIPDMAMADKIMQRAQQIVGSSDFFTCEGRRVFERLNLDGTFRGSYWCFLQKSHTKTEAIRIAKALHREPLTNSGHTLSEALKSIDYYFD